MHDKKTTPNQVLPNIRGNNLILKLKLDKENIKCFKEKQKQKARYGTLVTKLSFSLSCLPFEFWGVGVRGGVPRQGGDGAAVRADALVARDGGGDATVGARREGPEDCGGEGRGRGGDGVAVHDGVARLEGRGQGGAAEDSAFQSEAER